MAQAATPARLGPDLTARLDGPDLTYWFVDRALGWSVVLQLVWVFPDRLDTALVDDVAAQLHHSGLHRRVEAPTVHGARPRWAASPVTIPAVHDETVAADAVERWSRDELYSVDLDAGAGRCWRLRAVPLADGGYALSLCTLHLVTDGQGFVRAAAAAFAAARGDVVRPVEGRARVARRRVSADGLDALRQLILGAVGLTRVFGGGLVHRRASTPDPRVPRAPLAQRSPEARVRWAVVSVPSDEWASAARRHDGTENTLFVAVIAGALRRSGVLPAGEPIKVGIRSADAEPTTTAPTPRPGSRCISTRRGAGSHAGASPCRAAYEALDGGRRDPTVHLAPLVTVVPPALAVRAVTAGGGMPDVMTRTSGPGTTTCCGSGRRPPVPSPSAATRRPWSRICRTASATDCSRGCCRPAATPRCPWPRSTSPPSRRGDPAPCPDRGADRMGSAAPSLVTAPTATTDARVTGPDETFMLVEALAGVETPIQMGWVFADDPGESAVEEIHARLTASPVHRMIATTRVPFARHRWIAAGPPEPPRVDVVPVEPEHLSRWFAELSTARRCGRHRDAAGTSPPRRPPTAAASCRCSPPTSSATAPACAARCSPDRGVAPDDPPAGPQGRIRDDLRDAGGQLLAAVRAVSRLVGAAVSSSRARARPDRRGAGRRRLDRPSPVPLAGASDAGLACRAV